MALKKNYFKGLQSGVNNSPIKMHHMQPGPIGVGTRAIGNLFNKVFGNTALTEQQKKQLEANKKSVEEGKQFTSKELLNMDPKVITARQAAEMTPPQTKDEYNERAYIRPYDNRNEGGGILGTGINLAYNNPKLLDIAMKIPGLNNYIVDQAKEQMKRSGGGSSTDIKQENPEVIDSRYEERIQEIKDQNQEVKDVIARGEKELYINNFGWSEEDFKIKETPSKKEFLKDYLPNYDGNQELDNHWSYKQGGKTPNPLDQFFTDKDLYQESKYTPKSDYYDFQKSYSVKGDQFDKNLLSKDISSNQAYDYLNSTAVVADDNGNDNIVAAGKLTNQQMMPYVFETNMIENDYFRNALKKYEEKNGVISEKEREKLTAAYGGNKSNEFLDQAFNDLYAGKGGYLKKGLGPNDDTYVEKQGPMYGFGEEEGQIKGLMNTDYGRSKVGFAMDNKLPYMSIGDSWDFQATGKGGYADGWDGGGYGGVSDQFKQAQLINQLAATDPAVNPFKLYDRFYFTPDKYRDYIPDKDVKFMKEFYGSDNYDNQDNGVERKNNPDWIKPLMDNEVIVKGKKNKKPLTEAELDAKYPELAEDSPIRMFKKNKPRKNISKRNVILD